MSQLSLFAPTMITSYTQLNIHQRINWKTWNCNGDCWPNVYYTIRMAQDQIKDWTPKPLLTDKRIQQTAPAYPPKYIYNYHGRKDY